MSESLVLRGLSMANRERGSVVGYALGAVLLLSVLVGGIWLLKNNLNNINGTAGNDQSSSTKTASNDSTTNSSDTTASNDQAAKNEAALKQQSGQSTNTTDSTSNGQSSGVTQVPHTATVPDTAAQSSSLPTTGPAEDGVVAVLGMGTLVGLSVAYVRSRAAIV